MQKGSYTKISIKKYLDYLGAKKPVPGGGSAASLVGSVGISLLLMVINFTYGKKKFKAVESKLRQIQANLEELKQKFIDLIQQDIEVYKKLAHAYKKAKLKKKEASQRNIQKALKEAVGPPLQGCKFSHQAIKLALEMLNKTNKLLISDLGIGVWFLKGVFESSLLNIQINLSKIDDKEFIISIRKIIEPLQEEIEEAKDIVLDEVNKVIAS